MSSTLILWTVLSYGHKSYSNKATLKTSLQTLYGRHHDLFDCYEIFISQMTMDAVLFTYIFPYSIIANTFIGLDCIYEQHDGCLIRSRICLPFASRWVHPRLFDGVRDAHLFSALCCPIICLYVLSSVLWCPLRFLHKNYLWFVFTSSCLWDGSSPIYVICACLRRVVCCFLFFFKNPAVSEANMVDTCKHFEIGSHLPVFVIEHLCRA